MGPRIKETGGGGATGLAENFMKILMQGMNTGSFGGGTAGQRQGGANPMGSTQGMFGVLNDILSGGAGQLGGSMQDMINKDMDRQTNNLRARFGTGGGTSFGTPAAFAEGVLRAESAPALTNAIGGLQMGAIQSILPIIAQLSGKGIAQRETIASPSPFSQFMNIAAPVAGAFINPSSLALTVPKMMGAGGNPGANEFRMPTPNFNFGGSVPRF